MTNTTIFMCGPKRDHECNSDGPEMCGGTNSEGVGWEAEATEENRKHAQWGSVSCSICGMSAMERGMWE